MAEINRKLDNINKMIKALERALKRLEQADTDDVEYMQDSVISRFKILLESIWKNMALVLYEQGFVDVPATPKGVINLALEAKFLTKQEHDDLLKYVQLRNMASHLYDQAQYVLIASGASEALILIKRLYDRMLINQLPINTN